MTWVRVNESKKIYLNNIKPQELPSTPCAQHFHWASPGTRIPSSNPAASGSHSLSSRLGNRVVYFMGPLNLATAVAISHFIGIGFLPPKV